MRSASAEACRACRHQPWLTRTPRCGLRTRPLRAVRPEAQGSYCTGLGRSMPRLGRACRTHRHIGTCHIGTWWQPAVPTHAPWHHRSSSSLSRSTETLPPRGAMATSRVDTYVPESPYCTYGLRVPARPACLRTKGAGQLAPVPHALYVRCTRTSLGHAVRTGRTVAHYRLRV